LSYGGIGAIIRNCALVKKTLTRQRCSV